MLVLLVAILFKFIRKGFKVFIIDSFENSSEGIIDRILEICKYGNNNPNIHLEVFKGSLCDKKFIKDVLSDNKENKQIHGVIHFGFKELQNLLLSHFHIGEIM